MRDNYSDLIGAVKSLTDGVRVLASNQEAIIKSNRAMAEELKCPSILVDTYSPEIGEAPSQGAEGDLIRSIEFLRRRILHGEKSSRKMIDAAVRGQIDQVMQQTVSVKDMCTDLRDATDDIKEVTDSSYFALGRTANAFEESISSAHRQMEMGIEDSIYHLQEKTEKAINLADARLLEMEQFTELFESVGSLEGYMKSEQKKVLELLDDVIYMAASAEGRAEEMNNTLLGKITTVVSSIQNGIKPLDQKIDAIKSQVESKLGRLGHNIQLDTSNIQTQPVTQGRGSRRK